MPRVLYLAGLGLIGGSIAASLRETRADWRVRVWDRRQSAVRFALSGGLAHEAAETLEAGVEGSDLVLLAAPVRAIREHLGRLGPHLRPGQVVTDVGSTKAGIVAEAARAVPEGTAFVGGHPIAGTALSGVENAVAGLFRGRFCVLTPTAGTPQEAADAVAGFWRDLGAEVIFLEASVHDALLARLSHLPNLVAYSLVQAVGRSVPPSDWRLAGGALEDFTRVARSPAAMWRDICLENRDRILQALDEFTDSLDELRRALRTGDGPALQDFFLRAAEIRRRRWTS